MAIDPAASSNSPRCPRNSIDTIERVYKMRAVTAIGKPRDNSDLIMCFCSHHGGGGSTRISSGASL
ncbi:hypothetical protein Lal_00045385 [Lupinus albus]|nr:hypothetical protein Lal_00045385 [Lupinus albus]